MKNKKAYSLVELVIVILIVGILATVGSMALIFTVQDYVYVPQSLNMSMLVEDVLNKIIDGDNLARGLRFCKNITAYSANSITFTDQNSKTVIIALSGGKITRTINAVADNTFIYYQSPSNITILNGRNGALFLYYNSAEGTPATANDIRRIEINLIARTGSGSFANWQGQEEYSSSVFTPRFI